MSNLSISCNNLTELMMVRLMTSNNENYDDASLVYVSLFSFFV